MYTISVITNFFIYIFLSFFTNKIEFGLKVVQGKREEAVKVDMRTVKDQRGKSHLSLTMYENKAHISHITYIIVKITRQIVGQTLFLSTKKIITSQAQDVTQRKKCILLVKNIMILNNSHLIPLNRKNEILIIKSI